MGDVLIIAVSTVIFGTHSTQMFFGDMLFETANEIVEFLKKSSTTILIMTTIIEKLLTFCLIIQQKTLNHCLKTGGLVIFLFFQLVDFQCFFYFVLLRINFF